jgi:MFS transporter, NNP family, nitrate/nitrite transporter
MFAARWIEEWNPEDEEFWRQSGGHVAKRNLICSAFSEHIGFSVWTIWSVMVLFMSPEIGLGFSVAEKFLIVTTPSAVGALLRIPYSCAVTRFGGRNWTVLSTGALLVPTALTAYFVTQPGTPLWVFLVIGALTGLGGGGFASSMTNITAFYPQRYQGWALGVNAGVGNIGVAVVQLVGLTVIAFFGSTHPVYVCAVYLPLVVLSALLAALRMDNLKALRREPGTVRAGLADKHAWGISLLYTGTFGSFIGYSFAFGLVLQGQFGFTSLQAATCTWLGPLLGSLARPVGGQMSDRWGGALVTSWTFLAMAAATGMLLMAASQRSQALYVVAFVVLFVLTGVGNGSTFKMIPALYHRQAEQRVAGHGEDAFAWARRFSGVVMSIAGAVGSAGGVLVNLAFRSSFSGPTTSGNAALVGFAACYAACALVTYVVYLRGALRPVPVPRALAESETAHV